MSDPVEVVSSAWDHNGSFRVQVAGPWPRTAKGERAARDAARKVDKMKKVEWTRLDRVTLDPDNRVIYHFTVSRLTKEHK